MYLDLPAPFETVFQELFKKIHSASRQGARKALGVGQDGCDGSAINTGVQIRVFDLLHLEQPAKSVPILTLHSHRISFSSGTILMIHCSIIADITQWGFIILCVHYRRKMLIIVYL